jgi:pilus assembly protein CpaE
VAVSRILLISNSSQSPIARALEAAGHGLTRAADAEAAADAGGEPEVVVVDLDGAPGMTVDACRAVRAIAGLSTVPILAVSRSDDVEERIDLLETGVDDVIATPVDARELEARVEALALRYQRSRDIAAGGSGAAMVTFRDSGQERLIAVFSPKGGVGTTTVAVNVAAALAGRHADHVAIIDLDLQFGQVATHLNITPRLSIADIAKDDVALKDPGVLPTYVERHESGLAVMAAPSTPDGGSSITEATVRQLLDTASRGYRYVVVDAGSGLDARSEAVLRRATDVVIVVTPEFPALKAVHSLRDLLAGSGVELGETSFVLNQIFAREMLRLRDIEEALDSKIALTIPYDAFAFLKSVNEGVPVVLGAPRSGAAEQLFRLATRITGGEASAAPAERRSKGLGSLFGRG